MSFFYGIRDKKKNMKKDILVEAAPMGSWSGRIFFNPFPAW